MRLRPKPPWAPRGSSRAQRPRSGIPFECGAVGLCVSRRSQVSKPIPCYLYLYNPFSSASAERGRAATRYIDTRNLSSRCSLALRIYSHSTVSGGRLETKPLNLPKAASLLDRASPSQGWPTSCCRGGSKSNLRDPTCSKNIQEQLLILAFAGPVKSCILHLCVKWSCGWPPRPLPPHAAWVRGGLAVEVSTSHWGILLPQSVLAKWSSGEGHASIQVQA